MMMKQLKIKAVQDGGEISEKVVTKYKLAGRDFRLSYSEKKEKNVYTSNFVGIVRSTMNDEEILFSMPKHYMKVEKFDELSIEDKLDHIKIIMQSINKAVLSSQYMQYRHDKDVAGNFSFEAYREIYNYYVSYGLYKDEIKQYKKGYGNHIAWKKTISKSKKYIVNGKIFMLPMIVRKKANMNNLITECMIFVFNYTEFLYGQFMNIPNTEKIRQYGINGAILNNIDGVVDSLNEMKMGVFKDSELQLIDNLIIFLKRVNSRTSKVRTIKDYEYHYVWENAIAKYLNMYFSGIENDELIYSENKDRKFSFSKRTTKYDKQHENNSLEPDHYYYDDKRNEVYIFDSKYYVSLKHLNHKQLVYQYIFGNEHQDAKVYNALITPTEGDPKTSIHVEILPKFVNENEVKIYENKLPIKEVIINYISNS